MTSISITLAHHRDAQPIALMSRDTIEAGFPWRYVPARVLQLIDDAECNVAVARQAGRMIGFGIMSYGATDAHLQLLAVTPVARRQGTGAALVAWLETVARTAGIGTVNVECRADNPVALAFYSRLGYHQIGLIAGYYLGSIDALRLSHDLAGMTTP